jgi:hypothetical protein
MGISFFDVAETDAKVFSEARTASIALAVKEEAGAP